MMTFRFGLHINKLKNIVKFKITYLYFCPIRHDCGWLFNYLAITNVASNLWHY